MLARLLAILATVLALSPDGGLPGAQAAGALRSIAIVSSEEGGAYSELAGVVEAELAGGPVRLTVARVTLGGRLKDRASIPDADLIVAVGMRAARALAADPPRAPVLATLIPRSGWERLARENPDLLRGNRFGAVYMDQPLWRQLDLVRLALPGRLRLGAVLGPDSEGLQARLADAATVHGFRLALESIRAPGELVPALQRVLQESDVLLALPDAVVFNSATVQSVLLTSYRRQTPMVGFSPNYVRAGALLAVSSSPAQLGRQVAEIILQLQKGEAMPPPQHPRYYTVDVNHHVARSLGLQIASAESLEQNLRRLEARR